MEGSWVVAKFGGSSVRDAQAMLRCSQIIEDNPLIKIVVISATQNTTNHLEFIARAAAAQDRDELKRLTEELISRHLQLAKELFTSPKIIEDYNLICQELEVLAHQIEAKAAFSAQEMDELYAIGERISSLLISDLLRLRIPRKKIILIDAREIIKTDSDFQKAVPHIEIVAENCKKQIIPYLYEECIFVTQGFIGSDLSGNTTTLGREGSDYSAALLGEGIDAGLVQIWTDVPGVASTDPRIVNNVNFINSLSYDEATALASLGAKVLFPTTLLPTKRKNIPVFVGSSLEPSRGGTMITKSQDKHFSLKAVSTLDKNQNFYLSFIGTGLDLEADLESKIQAKMPDNIFTCVELTSVSISFKVKNTQIETAELLKLGHEILLNFSQLAE